MCGNAVLEQGRNIVVEYIRLHADVLLGLGLRITCGFGQAESIRYYMHGKWQLIRAILRFSANIILPLFQDWSTEGYQLFMLRQQKTYLDEEPPDTPTSTSNEVGGAGSPPKPQKPILTQTYSNLSDKSINAVPEPAYSIRTTLVQLDFVKSSFTVNPCMVRPEMIGNVRL